jgi:hypothetical protein
MSEKEEFKSETVNLWPEVGQRLGIGKNQVYEAAKRGEIEGLIRMGKRYILPRVIFERMLGGKS